ncbi:Glycosyltransferase involved in cell wall bisynthesis [Chitinophaga sp. CF118]|uniref:glycosyltransferase family 2 protein n=1 Tax=Chitinophaga sp. CF118 TaxID=1884367 RepID=UPI0008DF065D|nr:glycosyltransferase [Chitinophaga sp. CF118]SFD81806.1 Glycosyltransferase involved in cell wall bisynthesis [Chitinophaga sp. CF118]
MNQENIKVSVCIPAYKQVDYLQRLLDSLVIQTFTAFEIVITDDSPDNSVEALVQQYTTKLPIRYYRNVPARGMPGNWNTALDLAKGEYIKIMHDDDWFAQPDSLARLCQALDEHPLHDFAYSAYYNYYISSGETRLMTSPSWFRKAFGKNPVNVLQDNLVGPPSVVIHRNKPAYRYDEKVRWTVDVDFYIRLLKAHPGFTYINEPLCYVGMGKEQITEEVHNKREVYIPEYFYLLEKTGGGHFNSIFVYDFFWRLLRNMQITKLSDIREAGFNGTVPAVTAYVIRWQQLFPAGLLRIGAFSKLLMTISFLFASKQS